MASEHYPFPEQEMNVAPYEAKVIIRRSESIGKLVESLAKAQLDRSKLLFDHGAIARWRAEQSHQRTVARRPDILKKA